MITEEWKDIKDFEGHYQISNYGRIKSVARFANGKLNSKIPIPEKILKPSSNKKGYKLIRLRKVGLLKGYLVHRLVGIYFIPNPNNYPLINHIDEITHNNRGNDFYACEIDKEKFEAQELRFQNEIILQPKLIFENE